MSIALVQRLAFRQLPPHQKSVLLALANYAHEDGSGCRPALATIAAWTGRSVRRTQVAMRELRQAGLIVVTRTHAPHRPTEYALMLERLEALPSCRRQASQPDLPDLFSTFPQVCTGINRTVATSVHTSPASPDPVKGSVYVGTSTARARKTAG